MTDVFSKEKRSWLMGRVKGRDTKPEVLVRALIHGMGYRFRIHRRDLPGNPDIVLPRHRKVILVHGCFWHGHKGCRRATRPATNESFWNQKLDGNIRRDERFKAELRRLGWKVLVVWECETHKPEKLIPKLSSFLNGQTNKDEQAS